MRIISRHIKLLIPSLLLFLITGASLCAQPDTLNNSRKSVSYIYFHINESYLDPELKENRKTVERISSLIDSVGHSSVLGISVSSFASPDGPFRKNLALADRRAAAMSSFFKEVSPQSADLLRYGKQGESWERFEELMVQDTVIPNVEKDKILAIIASDRPEDEKERLLKKTESYLYLRDVIYPVLRYSCITIHYPLPPALERIRMAKSGELAPLSAPSLATRAYQPETKYMQSELFYLRSNLLSPFTNFGVEYCINNRWSIGADYYFPWVFRNPDNKNCFQILGGGIEGRYWFGDRNYNNRLEGHSVGANISGGYYDFEKGYTGNQGEFINIGVDYLYAMPIFEDRMHLEFTIGLGYIYSFVKPYDVLEPGGKAFKRNYTQNINWIGPSKAGVSLVVPIKSRRRECR